MYALASRLQACKQPALTFAHTAGMRDPTAPLLGYKEEMWNLESEHWREMEQCVHEQARKASVECGAAWRPGSFPAEERK